VHIELQTVGGGVRNLDMLQDGRADLAFSFSNVAYAAYTGEPERGGAFRNLRGIAVLDVAPMHFLVGPHSAIRGMSDLRGRRVDPGGPGSGAAQAFRVLGHAYGLAPNDVEVVVAGYEQGITQLVHGQLDAMFVLGDYPSEPVMRAVKGGAKLVSIAGPESDQLRAEFQFFVPALIPEQGYPGVTKTIRTIGVASILICRADLDERLVHDITAAIFNPQGNTTSLAQMRHWSDLRQAAATPIPLHPGAARYFRERELSP
jgi:TRAP transporter TAXI family solute receptor